MGTTKETDYRSLDEIIKETVRQALSDYFTELLPHLQAIINERKVNKTTYEINEKPFSLTEVATYFGKSRQTILSWRKSGQIPMGRRIGKSLFWERKEILNAAQQLSSRKEDRPW